MDTTDKSMISQLPKAIPLQRPVRHLVDLPPAVTGVDFLRKSLIVLFFLLTNNYLSLLLIGIVNRLLGRPLKAVFLVYPAHPKYAHKYAFKWAISYLREHPAIVGFYVQGFQAGLILGSSTTESLFLRSRDHLAILKRRLESFRRIVGAEHIHLAGTLPSVMSRFSLIDSSYLAERCAMTAEIIVDAERIVRERESVFEICPILLLGGKGSVGTALKSRLLEEGREVHLVDIGDEFPAHLRDQRAVLIDVSRKGVLEARIDTVWSELIILNETFPEPDGRFLKKLQAKGNVVYHVAGVRARAFPPFPYAYSGGIPCCAAIDNKRLETIVRRLTQ